LTWLEIDVTVLSVVAHSVPLPLLFVPVLLVTTVASSSSASVIGVADNPRTGLLE
jgi:hypothetical protein